MCSTFISGADDVRIESILGARLIEPTDAVVHVNVSDEEYQI